MIVRFQVVIPGSAGTPSRSCSFAATSTGWLIAERWPRPGTGDAIENSRAPLSRTASAASSAACSTAGRGRLQLCPDHRPRAVQPVAGRLRGGRRPRPYGVKHRPGRPLLAGLHDLDHRADVQRRGAAAAADEPGAGGDQPVRVPGEVLGVDLVLQPVGRDPPRQAGVGLHRQRQRRVPGQLGGHLQRALRAERAVDPEHGDRQPGQRVDHLAGRVPGQRPAVGRERRLRHDRHRRVLRRDRRRLDQLGEEAEGLQHQQVDAGPVERGDLLAQRPDPLGRRGRCCAAAR